MGWKEHAVQRSFDALRFVHVEEQGILWRGIAATYPPLIPDHHLQASRANRWRHLLFSGSADDSDDYDNGNDSDLLGPYSRAAKQFSASRQKICKLCFIRNVASLLNLSSYNLQTFSTM